MHLLMRISKEMCLIVMKMMETFLNGSKNSLYFIYAFSLHFFPVSVDLSCVAMSQYIPLPSEFIPSALRVRGKKDGRGNILDLMESAKLITP